MTETNKEYKLRCLCQSIMEFTEEFTNDFDELCNCECIKGIHNKNCKTTSFRKDFENFRKKLNEIYLINQMINDGVLRSEKSLDCKDKEECDCGFFEGTQGDCSCNKRYKRM